MFDSQDSPERVSAHSLLAAIGACVAISTVVLTAKLVELGQGAGLLVASMGASAVLMFCAPEGPLSRPWSVFGGHVLSAIVGVTCSLLLGDTTIAAAVSVGGAIFVMQLLRCVHPPGGATALSAVVGGAGTQMGYMYVVAPVLINVLTMLAVASLFHLPQKRYPLVRRQVVLSLMASFVARWSRLR
jgi:CBS domain-containing membrane protein